MSLPFYAGQVVKFENGFYRITSIIGKKNITVNLGSIFGSKIYHKRIAVDAVVDAEAEWYQRWSQSESYQCM
jgi:hypothetical protein